jgi:hypothetical protein
MAISLYDISVPAYLQTLGAVSGLLAKGRAHFEAGGISLDEIVETRLIDNMNPFRFQVVSVAHHSLGCIQGLQRGSFSPPDFGADLDYVGLERLVRDAAESLQGFEPEAINALEGQPLQFRTQRFELNFIAENFVTSFSLPNFYFHAATAYDILRMKGVPIGKLDFMGQIRVEA